MAQSDVMSSLSGSSGVCPVDSYTMACLSPDLPRALQVRLSDAFSAGIESMQRDCRSTCTFDLRFYLASQYDSEAYFKSRLADYLRFVKRDGCFSLLRVAHVGDYDEDSDSGGENSHDDLYTSTWRMTTIHVVGMFGTSCDDLHEWPSLAFHCFRNYFLGLGLGYGRVNSIGEVVDNPVGGSLEDAIHDFSVLYAFDDVGPGVRRTLSAEMVYDIDQVGFIPVFSVAVIES